MRRSASFDNFCCPARSSMALHRLAHLKLEVLEQRGQLGFQLAGAIAQLDVALAREPGSLLIERVLLVACGFAVSASSCGKFVMQFVEEAGDIHLLRT